MNPNSDIRTVMYKKIVYYIIVMEEHQEIDSLLHMVITEDMTNFDLSYKLIIIGETGVGKSCLMLRGTKDEFREDHDVTIGVEYGSFSLKIRDKSVKIYIWDTAGQETFQSIAKVFYKGSQCIFLVYDMTIESSFAKLSTWLKEIRETASVNAMIILVGNMLDLEQRRAVSREKALEFQRKEKLDGFFETSAKSGANVQDLFARAAKMLFLRDKEKNGMQTKESIKIVRTQAKLRRRCAC